jgi:hypothetical protein
MRLFRICDYRTAHAADDKTPLIEIESDLTETIVVVLELLFVGFQR